MTAVWRRRVRERVPARFAGREEERKARSTWMDGGGWSVGGRGPAAGNGDESGGSVVGGSQGRIWQSLSFVTPCPSSCHEHPPCSTAAAAAASEEMRSSRSRPATFGKLQGARQPTPDAPRLFPGLPDRGLPAHSQSRTPFRRDCHCYTLDFCCTRLQATALVPLSHACRVVRSRQACSRGRGGVAGLRVDCKSASIERPEGASAFVTTFMPFLCLVRDAGRCQSVSS